MCIRDSKSTLLKRNIPIQLNAKGLFLVDLNGLITPTSQDAEAEPAETSAVKSQDHDNTELSGEDRSCDK